MIRKSGNRFSERSCSKKNGREFPGGLSEVGIDAGLPPAAGLSIGRENIVIEAQLHGLFRMFKGWPVGAMIFA